MSFAFDSELRRRQDEASRNCFVRVAAGALLIASAAAGSAQAQSLANIPGSTALQQRTGAAVAAVCGPLAAAGTNRNGSAPVEDLFGRCQDLVHTGNAIVGSGVTAFSLGLTADQTNQALQQVTSEETSAQGTNTTDLQAARNQAIAGRLSALRGGAGGLSVAGLQIQSPSGTMVSLADMMPAGLTAGQDDGSEWWSGRLSAFISGTIGTGDVDASAEEIGYDLDFYALTFGADYRITDTAVLGLAFGYARNESDFDANGGDMDTKAYSLTAYGTASLTENAYIDGSLGYTRNDFDMTRRIVYPTVNRTAKSDTDGYEIEASVGGGYDFAIGAFNLTPTARLNYLKSDIDGFTESGAAGLNLVVDDQDLKSISSSLGAELSYAISTDFGVVVPAVRGAWIHEFDDDSRVISLRYAADPGVNTFTVITNSPDRNYAELGASVVTILPGGNSLFFDFTTVAAHENVNVYAFTAGARIEF